MAWGALLVGIQVGLVIHAAKNGNYYWIFIIMFFPLIGGLAYFFIAVLPDLRQSSHVRDASTGLARTINPRGGLKRSLDRLAIADTAANKAQVADEYLALGMHEEAVQYFGKALSGHFGQDPPLLFGLANAYFQSGDFGKAKETLEQIEQTNSSHKQNERHLLTAMVLEALGDTQGALKAYEYIAPRFTGPEAKCRYGLFLEKTGQPDKAKEVFEEVYLSAKRTPGHYRRLYKQWITLAKKQSG